MGLLCTRKTYAETREEGTWHVPPILFLRNMSSPSLRYEAVEGEERVTSQVKDVLFGERGGGSQVDNTSR